MLPSAAPLVCLSEESRVFIAYAVVAVVLAFGLLMSGRAKVVGDERIVSGLLALGVPRAWLPRLAICEFAGALGLLAGLVWRPFGIAAGVGLVLYFVGAVITHVRASDVKGLPTPMVMLVVSAVALSLAGLSA
jgi:hypothetical protein